MYFTDFPEDVQPGDYWKVVDEEGEAISLKDAPTNLTGQWWHVVDPLGGHGNLMNHTVREHEDGMISVRPNDGSSNSILITQPRPDGDIRWHGYIEHGVWTEC